MYQILTKARCFLVGAVVALLLCRAVVDMVQCGKMRAPILELRTGVLTAKRGKLSASKQTSVPAQQTVTPDMQMQYAHKPGWHGREGREGGSLILEPAVTFLRIER